MRQLTMKPQSTLLLRAAAVAMGLAVLAGLVILVRPALGIVDANGFRPIIIGMFVAAVPFYIALYQAMRLLGLVDRNEAFSPVAVQALGIIKYAAFGVGLLYAGYLPLFYERAQTFDAPGLMGIPTIISFAGIVIGIFAAVLQQLIRSAIEIKSENDLTV